MLERIVLLLIGVPVAAGGLGMTVSFGVLAIIGMPVLILGLGLISAATR